MDPVSRRLTAAAMGLAFGLSRDDELEQTRLDLERARMEREDFRNGGGPETSFMHTVYPHQTPKEYERMYKFLMKPYVHVEYQDTVRKALKRSLQYCDNLQEDLEVAVAALKRIAVSGSIEAADEATSALAAMGRNEDNDSEED